MSSFLTNHGVVVALVCAACAVAYGLLTTRSLLALSPGNERMQAISAGRPAGRPRLPEPPVHDDRGRRRGAVRRADLHPEHRGRVRLPDRRRAVRLDRLHRHERVGARQRARRRGGARRRLAGAEGRLPRRRDHRACWSSASALFGVAGYYGAAHGDLQRQPQDGRRRAHRPRLRRLADLGLRAARRRHLHQGGRRRRRPGRARSRRASPRTTRATRRRSPTTSATTSATAPAWRPTCSRPTRSPRSP